MLKKFEDTLVRMLLLAAVVSFVLALYDGTEGGEVGAHRCRPCSIGTSFFLQIAYGNFEGGSLMFIL